MSRLSEITPEQRERLRENTIRMAGGLPFIQYDWEHGQFRMGGDKDVTDNDFLAVIDRCEAVWNCFLNGTVKELVRVNMMDGDIPPKPQGYDDQSKWEKWEKGKNKGEPKNPLMLQYEMPLIMNDDDNERIIKFKASAKLAKEAVQRLLDAVNANDRLRRPFVTLTVAPNPDNIHQMLPDFTITGYSDDLADIVLPGDNKPDKPATNGSDDSTSDPISTGSGATPRRNSDVDDDIPFAPEFR